MTKRPRTGEGCDPGNSGKSTLGMLVRCLGGGLRVGYFGTLVVAYPRNGVTLRGVRVRRPFGARGMSSVRYRTRLGDLENKQSTERVYAGIGCNYTVPKNNGRI